MFMVTVSSSNFTLPALDLDFPRKVLEVFAEFSGWRSRGWSTRWIVSSVRWGRDMERWIRGRRLMVRHILFVEGRLGRWPQAKQEEVESDSPSFRTKTWQFSSHLSRITSSQQRHLLKNTRMAVTSYQLSPELKKFWHCEKFCHVGRILSRIKCCHGRK